MTSIQLNTLKSPLQFATLTHLPSQTASEHYLPLWGMKPSVLEQRNLLDLHTLILTHEGLLTRRHPALAAGQAEISQIRSS
jgi:hypothetical protein